MKNTTKRSVNSLNKSDIKAAKDLNIISSKKSYSFLVEKPFTNERCENKDSSSIEKLSTYNCKAPYSFIERLKIKLEIKEKRVKELEQENEKLKEINMTLMTSLSRKDDYLIDIQKENKNITKLYNKVLLEKENIKLANQNNKGILDITKPNLKLIQPFKLNNKTKVSLDESKLKIGKNKSDEEEGLEEFIKKHGLSITSFESSDKDNNNIYQNSSFKKKNNSDFQINFTPFSQKSSISKSPLVNSKENLVKDLKLKPTQDRLFSPKSTNSKIILTEQNVKTTHFTSHNDLNQESALYSGGSDEFYDRVLRMHTRQGHRYRFSKFRPSFLTMKEDFISRLIKSDSIKEIFHITNSGDDFIHSLSKFKEDKIKLIGETINNTFRDYVNALRVIIRIKHFLNVSIRVSNAMPVEEATTMLINNACEILECERTSIFVYDRFSNMLTVHQGEGLEGFNLKIPIDSGIVGYVFSKGERQRIDDAYLDSRFNQEIDKKTGYKTRTLLCTPLKNTQGEVFGVLEAINKNIGVFNTDDEELIDLFGTQASLILNNSIYFDDNATFVYRMKILIEFSIVLQNVRSLLEFTDLSEMTLVKLWKMNISRLLIVTHDGQLMHFEKYINLEFKNYLGLVGHVYTKKEFIGIENANENAYYNALVDIETGNAILTFPLINSQEKLIGIAQTSYPNKLVKNQKPQEIDMFIIDYFSKITSCWLENFLKLNCN